MIEYKIYAPENLQRALEAVFNDQMNCKEAAITFGIPQATLYRRYTKYHEERTKLKKKWF